MRSSATTSSRKLCTRPRSMGGGQQRKKVLVTIRSPKRAAPASPGPNAPFRPASPPPVYSRYAPLRRGGFSGSYLPTKFCSFAPLGSRDFETSFHLKRGLVPGKTPRFHSNPEHNQPDGSGWSRVTTPPLYPWLFPPWFVTMPYRAREAIFSLIYVSFWQTQGGEKNVRTWRGPPEFDRAKERSDSATRIEPLPLRN